MDRAGRRKIVGIDLGTTNSAVSWADPSGDGPTGDGIEIFPIPQLTGPAEISPLPMLPSFLYIPGEHELRREAYALPWPSHNRGFVGTFARRQGAAVPGRLVSSAKSWLCQAKADRRAPILPWGAGEEVDRISPVDATAAVLQHIRSSWNHLRQEKDGLPLEDHRIVVTVPASFDEVARDLTVEAAALAGLPHVLLLEEPLAAFYSWLMDHEKDWESRVARGELILICDVGGGTTDFTLVTLREKGGVPVFERIAVGDHLILGGDNMDLALARLAERKLWKDRNAPLSLNRRQALCHQCREAKEKILGGKAEDETITLVGEGRRLVGGTVTTKIGRMEIEEILLQGFFPPIEPGTPAARETRRGITEFGLPYAQNPAVTAHLVQFLERHRADVLRYLGREDVCPDRVLFNGGTLKPPILRERILEALSLYFRRPGNSSPKSLENRDLELAVARGAAYYGRVREGRGVRVGSGSARAYYLGVSRREEENRDAPPVESALCLVERNTQEGTRAALHDFQFEVRVNRPVRFDLYSSSFRAGDRVGDLIPVDDSITLMPPLQTVIKFGRKAGEITVPVAIEAAFTELGTLEIWCRSRKSDHRWRLRFQLRESGKETAAPEREILDKALEDRTLDLLEKAFADPSFPLKPEALTGALRETLEISRDRWPPGLLRAMADRLLDLASARHRTLEHEIRWMNLIGFCLRPGFGHPMDDHRMERLWKFFAEGPLHDRKIQARSEWWILWRRVAGGLSEVQQRQIMIRLTATLAPGRKGRPGKVPPQEHMEMWMTAANLERLPIMEKTKLGRILLNEPASCGNQPQYGWALGRLGAREPLYGPIDRVVPAEEVVRWIETLLARSRPHNKAVEPALTQMARLTGDRKRDLDPAVRHAVIAWLKKAAVAEKLIRPLEEVVPVSEEEETAVFGESLPPGIILHGR